MDFEKAAGYRDRIRALEKRQIEEMDRPTTVNPKPARH